MTHKHWEWEALIPFYVAQTLPKGQALELAQHLKTCAACRQAYAEWREIAAAVQGAADDWSRDLPPLSDTVRAQVAQRVSSRAATQHTPKVVQNGRDNSGAEAATDIKTQRSIPSVPPTSRMVSIPPAPPPSSPKLLILPPPRKRRSPLPLVMAAVAVSVFALLGVFALLAVQGALVLKDDGQRTPDNIAVRQTAAETPVILSETPINERRRATPTFTVTTSAKAPNNTPIDLPQATPAPALFSLSAATDEVRIGEAFAYQGRMSEAVMQGGIDGTGACPEVYFFGSACEARIEVILQRFEFGIILKHRTQNMALVIFDNGRLGEPYRVEPLVGAPLEGQFAPALALIPYYRTALGWAILDPQVYGLVINRTFDGAIQINLPDRMIALSGDLTTWTTITPPTPAPLP